MDVSIIGAGRVAGNLAQALVRAGHRLRSVHNRDVQKAERVVQLAIADSRPAGGDLPRALSIVDEIPEETECAIFCIADDALADVIEGQSLRADLLCLHTAGSLSIDIWRGRATEYGVLYPLQTFSEATQEIAVCFKELPLFIEASDETQLERVEQLALSLSSQVYRLNSEQRRWLHVSAVFGCNFVNSLYGAAAECLQEIGLPLSVLYGLIDETAQKVHRLSPREAQTGPASRKDRGVVTKQMELLREKPELQEVYRMLSERIMGEKL